jgi:ABC-type multidrug transport system ATPase subunit
METELKIRNGNKIVLYGPNGAGKSTLIRDILKRLTENQKDVVEIDAKSAVLVTESGAKQFNIKIFTPDEFSFADNFAVVDPAVSKRLYLEVYYDKAYDPDLGWIPIRQLSYGQKRRLVIDVALVADFVAIENFEAGLHADYIADLVKQIAESDATVVLETHSGLVLKLATRYGCDAFYVEPFMRLRRIERLDDAQMFARELSAFNAIVV